MDVCPCADLTMTLQPKVSLLLSPVPSAKLAEGHWSARSSGEGEGGNPAAGPGREAWGPSRRRRQHAWRPDQVLEMRYVWLRRACTAPFGPGVGPQGTKQLLSLFLSVSVSLYCGLWVFTPWRPVVCVHWSRARPLGCTRERPS